METRHVGNHNLFGLDKHSFGSSFAFLLFLTSPSYPSLPFFSRQLLSSICVVGCHKPPHIHNIKPL